MICSVSAQTVRCSTHMYIYTYVRMPLFLHGDFVQSISFTFIIIVVHVIVVLGLFPVYVCFHVVIVAVCELCSAGVCACVPCVSSV